MVVGGFRLSHVSVTTSCNNELQLSFRIILRACLLRSSSFSVFLALQKCQIVLQY